MYFSFLKIEDVFESGAGNVIAELSLLFVFHRIVIV